MGKVIIITAMGLVAPLRFTDENKAADFCRVCILNMVAFTVTYE